MSRPSRTRAEKLARFHLHTIIAMSMEDSDALPGQVVKLAKQAVKLLDGRLDRRRERARAPGVQ